MLFDCSRTIVREALTRLAARGIVTVSARRGWFVIEPSQDEAREAFEARRVIEVGLIRSAGSPAASTRPRCKQLKAHLQREKAALKDSDVGTRSFLLGDFHVCLAECLGNTLLADTLRDFTARTTLIAMLYQSSHDAAQSCDDHVRIVDGAGARRRRRGRGADGRAHRHRAVGPARCRPRPTRWRSCATRWRPSPAPGTATRHALAYQPPPARPPAPHPAFRRLIDLPRSPAMNRFIAKRTLRRSALAVAPPCSPPAGAHAQTALDDIMKAKTIKIAIPTDYPPYGFVGTD